MEKAQFAMEFVIVLSMLVLAMPMLSAFVDSVSKTSSASLVSKQQELTMSVLSDSINKACLNSLAQTISLPCTANSLSNGNTVFQLSSASASTAISLKLIYPLFSQPAVSKAFACSVNVINSPLQLSCDRKLSVSLDSPTSTVSIQEQ